MAIPKFFHNPESAHSFVIGDIILLNEEEARHASIVRRLQIGSEVCLLNGEGYVFNGHFVELSKRIARVQIDKIVKYEKPKSCMRIAVAIPKGDRQKIMLDMLTQCGVREFIPLSCEFSSTTINPKQVEKWQKIIVEACKQSGNPFVMKVHQILTIDQLMKTNIWRDSDVFRAEQISASTKISTNKDKLTLIGPEGGFSDMEKQKMDAAGAKLINLGPYILRTEAAAIAAVSVLNH